MGTGNDHDARITADFSGDNFLLRVKRDDGQWIVSEDSTACYGVGRTLLEAMADLWSALFGLIDVAERNEPLDGRLDRQVQMARALIEVRHAD